MSRQSDKIVKGAQEFLEPGEEVQAAIVAAARGLTVRGGTFKLEANAASGAPALAEAFERVRGVRA